MIRPATVADVAAVACIHVHASQVAYRSILPPEFLAQFSIPQRTTFWHRELSSSCGHVMVAEEEGSITGWISGGASRDLDGEGASEVYAVYVAPDRWRKGIGRQLMAALEQQLAPVGDITLWVLLQNRRAVAFYQKLGYNFDGAEKSQQRGGVTIVESRLRKNRPNKAPEPTITSVTPRASSCSSE